MAKICVHSWREYEQEGIRYKQCRACQKRAAIHPHTAKSYVWVKAPHDPRFTWCIYCHAPKPVFGRPHKGEAAAPPPQQVAFCFDIGEGEAAAPVEVPTIEALAVEVIEAYSGARPGTAPAPVSIIPQPGGAIIFACARPRKPAKKATR